MRHTALAIAIALIQSSAYAVDEASANKAMTLVQNAFSCSPPVVSSQSGTTSTKTVTEMAVAGDPTWFQIDETTVSTASRPQDTSVGKPTYKKSRYSARLKDLKFEATVTNSNWHLSVTCTAGDSCISHTAFAKRDGETWRRSSNGSSSYASIDLLACTDRAAKALSVGYSTAAAYAANKPAPDETAWEHLKGAKDALAIRDFLRRFPGTNFATDARELLQNAEAESGPAKDYGKLIDLEFANYYAAKTVPISPGPSSRFTPIGSYEAGATVHSSGSTSNGLVDDEWLEVTFERKTGYVERKAVLSDVSRALLFNYRERKEQVRELVSQSSPGRFSRRAGIYGFGCMKPLKPEQLFLAFETRNMYLLDKQILISDGDNLIIASALHPQNYQRVALSRSRTVSFNKLGSVQLYKTRYLHGTSDYGEIGFAKDGTATFRTGKEIIFTFAKRCSDQSVTDVLAMYDWMIENFKDD